MPNSRFLVILTNKICYGVNQLKSFLLFEAQRMLSVIKSTSSQVCLGADHHARVGERALEVAWWNRVYWDWEDHRAEEGLCA